MIILALLVLRAHSKDLGLIITTETLIISKFYETNLFLIVSIKCNKNLIAVTEQTLHSRNDHNRFLQASEVTEPILELATID